MVCLFDFINFFRFLILTFSASPTIPRTGDILTLSHPSGGNGGRVIQLPTWQPGPDSGLLLLCFDF
jgi:hypothetical protein